MTAVPARELDHHIAGVTITTVGGRHAVCCPCGWTSRACRQVRDAVADWQQHRGNPLRLG